jgi:hypothetical protein
MSKIMWIIIASLFLSGTSFAADDLKSAFKEAEISGQFRLQRFERDYDARTDREDIAAGGMFYYRTAPLSGVSLGFAFYTGQGMGLNDSDKDVYGLLNKDEAGNHDSFVTLGESFISIEKYDSILKIGRQEQELPWINGDDNRLTPQSTQAYTFVNNSIPNLEIFVSHVTKMRGKAAENFDSMTGYAGLSQDNRGVTVAALAYGGIENVNLQIWNFHAYDFLNNIYFKAGYEKELRNGSELSLGLQYLNQSDAGKKLGGAMDTYTVAAEVGYKINGFKGTFAMSTVDDQDIQYPWGHDFFVSTMTTDSYRADETGYMVTLAYDFEKIGVPGLKAKFAHGDFDTPDTGVLASPDMTETDFDLKYKFSGDFDGLGLRVRYGIINQEEDLGGEDYNDFRLYLTYDF